MFGKIVYISDNEAHVQRLQDGSMSTNIMNMHVIFEDEKKKIFEKNGLKIDCDSRRVFVEDKEVKLTAKEYDLLELLSFHPNKVYSRENLLNIVWGYDYPGDVRTVDVHIRRLREKIEKNPSDPKYVHTKWGVGYYFRG